MKQALQKTWFYTLSALTFLIGVPLLFILSAIILIVTLPYTLFYWSPHWGMRSSDMPPVKLYLDHFNRLHPDLMAKIYATFERLESSTWKRPTRPPGLQFWPNKSETFIIQTWSCSTTTALFAVLEDAGWPRRVVWTFLRDEVEKNTVELEVTDTQKEEFARVMEKMNSHSMFDFIGKLSKKIFSVRKNREACDTVFNFDPPSDMQGVNEVINASLDSLDWLLRPGCVVRPYPEDVWKSQDQLFSLGLYFEDAWGTIKKERDLEKGMGEHWQILDLRYKKPWEK